MKLYKASAILFLTAGPVLATLELVEGQIPIGFITIACGVLLLITNRKPETKE